MLMAKAAQYEHSAVSGTWDFGGVPDIEDTFPGRTVYPKGGTVIREHDPDKKFTKYTLYAQLTGEEYFDLRAAIRSTTTYTGTYPRLVHVKLQGDTTHDLINVLVMPISLKAKPYSNTRVMVTLVCVERSA